MNRPKKIDFDELEPALQRYIVYLEELADEGNTDPIVGLLNSLKTQVSNISKILGSTQILDITDGDDKLFDRVLKLSTESKKIVENIKYLENQISGGEEDDPEPELGSVESFVRNAKK